MKKSPLMPGIFLSVIPSSGKAKPQTKQQIDGAGDKNDGFQFVTGADGVGGARDALGMAGEGRAGEQPEQAGRRDGSVGEVARHGRGKQGEMKGFAAGKAEFDGDGAFA